MVWYLEYDNVGKSLFQFSVFLELSKQYTLIKLHIWIRLHISRQEITLASCEQTPTLTDNLRHVI